MTVEITVRGTHRRYAPAQRATVHASISLEGKAADQVYGGVADALSRVSSGVEQIHDPTGGPVTWWSADQVRTWAERPWHQDGKRLPLVHHARAQLQVKFRDFSALGSWLGTQSAVPGFSVSHIEWALTETHRTSQVADVRAHAVRDAQEKAQTYADALGLGPVRVAALADAGMLGAGQSPHAVAEAQSMRAFGGDTDTGELQLVPQDIELRADVDARFQVGD